MPGKHQQADDDDDDDDGEDDRQSLSHVGVPPRWRIRSARGHAWPAKKAVIMTKRPNGSRQGFSFVQRDSYLESMDEIPEPHAFLARLSLGHGNHTHDYDPVFAEGHGHEDLHGLGIAADGYQDVHERAHANDVRGTFQDRNVTAWQISLFDLTGGLIPCPAAITVLLLCLQFRQFSLGFVLVLCPSFSLAITLVTVGALAALSIGHPSKRWSWLNTVARRASYMSSLLIIAVGVYVGIQGCRGLAAGHHEASRIAIIGSTS